MRTQSAAAVAIQPMVQPLKNLPRLVQINKILEALAIDAQLVRGKGYFYVIGKDTEHSTETSIYTDSLYQLSMDQWISEILGIVGETLNARGLQS